METLATYLPEALNEAPLYLDVLAPTGELLAVNKAQAQALSYGQEELRGKPGKLIYTEESLGLIESLFASCRAGEVREQQRLTLRGRDKRSIQVIANAEAIALQDGIALRLAKIRLHPALVGREQDEREIKILRGFVTATRDACWCIEFAEPVDLSASEEEIVRQVFENECYWRLCNEAMAQLYRLPEGLDFNQENVRFVFPRNPENEAFIRQLNDAKFHLDGAPSLDQRYDGAQMYAENDVRAEIRNGYLLRMWGTVRDLSLQRERERRLTRRADQVADILSALPDPVLVFDEAGVLEAANPALEWLFGWRTEELLGRSIRHILAFEEEWERIVGAARPGAADMRLDAAVLCSDGRRLNCAVSIGTLPFAGEAKRLVAILRKRDQGRAAA